MLICKTVILWKTHNHLFKIYVQDTWASFKPFTK